MDGGHGDEPHSYFKSQRRPWSPISADDVRRAQADRAQHKYGHQHSAYVRDRTFNLTASKSDSLSVSTPLGRARVPYPVPASSAARASAVSGSVNGPSWWGRLYRADNRALAAQEARDRAEIDSYEASTPRYTLEKLFPTDSASEAVGSAEAYASERVARAAARRAPAPAATQRPVPGTAAAAAAAGGTGAYHGPRPRLRADEEQNSLTAATNSIVGMPSRGLPVATVGFGPANANLVKGSASAGSGGGDASSSGGGYASSFAGSSAFSSSLNADTAGSRRGGPGTGLNSGGPTRPSAAVYPAADRGDVDAAERLRRAGLDAAVLRHTKAATLPPERLAALPPWWRDAARAWQWARDPRAALPLPPEVQAAHTAAAEAGKAEEREQRAYLGAHAFETLKQTRAAAAAGGGAGNDCGDRRGGPDTSRGANGGRKCFGESSALPRRPMTHIAASTAAFDSAVAATSGDDRGDYGSGSGDGTALPPGAMRRLSELGVPIERVPPHRRVRPVFVQDPVSRKHGFLLDKDFTGSQAHRNYNQRELYVIWVKFKALCGLSNNPEGVSKEVFKKGVLRLTVEDDIFVNRVYELVDEDGSGAIEWHEFLQAMDALENGTLETKCKFFMQVYDYDGDGVISRSDLHHMFTSSSLLLHDKEEKKKRRVNELLSLAHGFFRPSDRPRLLKFKQDVVELVESLPEDEDDEEAAANRTAQEVVRTFVDKVFARLGKLKEDDTVSLDDVVSFMRELDTGEDVWAVFGRSMLKDFDGRK